MKKGRFLWSAHRITKKQKAGKARNIKEKQLKNSRSTVSKPPVALLSSASVNRTYSFCNTKTQKVLLQNQVMFAAASFFLWEEGNLILHPNDVIVQIPAGIAEGVIRRGTSHSNECCHRAEFSEGWRNRRYKWCQIALCASCFIGFVFPLKCWL